MLNPPDTHRPNAYHNTFFNMTSIRIRAKLETRKVEVDAFFKYDKRSHHPHPGTYRKRLVHPSGKRGFKRREERKKGGITHISSFLLFITSSACNASPLPKTSPADVRIAPLTASINASTLADSSTNTVSISGPRA